MVAGLMLAGECFTICSGEQSIVQHVLFPKISSLVKAQGHDDVNHQNHNEMSALDEPEPLHKLVILTRMKHGDTVRRIVRFTNHNLLEY